MALRETRSSATHVLVLSASTGLPFAWFDEPLTSRLAGMPPRGHGAGAPYASWGPDNGG